ncbi:hypothetical protein AXK12_07525 [Cephaloticoccus capnophilus]|uniref:Glycosyl transferase family 1 domain-containing protein n=1 Tax=Cephaloticoccus capnophilus TaxID=1548208 RepID=A0A139SIE0_9BACT|nr:glycosyltransferase family 1 protein [Cephaloticoccus capnophilus]KXU34317.1 hypothetical protein AXK12_07525 [Cephaloticoccus capnophilus]
MHLLDLTHTAHTRVQTGIQVVCRALYAELAKRDAARPITWDRYAKEWRELQAWEQANLDLHAKRDDERSPSTSNTPTVTQKKAHAKRSAQWPLSARVNGRLRRLCRALGAPCADSLATHAGATASKHNSASGLIIPELFAPSLARYHAQLRVQGPRVAIFHDAIPLKYPELSPAKTVAFYPGYLHSLLQFDGIAANSEDSAQTLRDYFRWLAPARTPQVTAIPLGVNLPATIPPPLTFDASAPSSELPTILSIGSIEGRKNHLSLLDAAESLWARGRRFTLYIIGLAQAETGRAALEKIRALQAAGRPLRYPGHADLATVEAAYAECRFTVYPSIIEGFGLPVIESLARGRPCICSGKGALGEVAAGGGTLTLDEMTSPAIATAIDTLLQNPDTLSQLATEARARRFRTWAEYTDSLLDWMSTL